MTISDLDKQLFLHKKDEEVVRIIEKTVTEKEISDVKGIIFCRNIQHMRHLLGFFELGTATLVHSKMSDQERRENIRNFREGDFKYILVCDLFNEGIDIPETNLLIFMRYTGSKTIWLQQLGRGLRKTPNKEFVHVLDFVGSLERLDEVNQLSDAVSRMQVDEESIVDDDDVNVPKQIIHDSTLEVKYSEEAARVLTLLEQMKFQLKSRELLIDKIREFKESQNYIPDITSLEESLQGISLDQIATHFGSYYGFLVTAFGIDIDVSFVLKDLRSFVEIFTLNNKIIPSYRAISHHFMHDQLCLFTEKEVKQLLPEVEKNSIKFKQTEKITVNEKNEKDTFCELLQTYKGIVCTRADLKLIAADDKLKIKEKYQSLSLFLKKIKGLT